MSRGSNKSKSLMYSAADTAAMLGIAKSTLLKHAKEGTLHPPLGFVRAGTAVKFLKADVDAFLRIEEAA